MEWIQVLVIIGSMIAIIIPLFLWQRSEGNADRRHLEQLNKNIISLMQSFHNDVQREIKDFHGRLISLEERTRK